MGVFDTLGRGLAAVATGGISEIANAAGGPKTTVTGVNPAKEKAMLDAAVAAREGDLAKGRARGQELFGEGSLGRLGADQTSAINDIMTRRQSMADKGLSAEENNALRDSMNAGINQNEQTQLRQLRGIQGATGVRGGLAGSQQAQVLANTAANKANTERDLFLKNIEAKNQALGDLEKSAMEIQKSNLDAQGREKFAQQATELGYGQLGSADRAAVNARLVGEAQAQAAAQQKQGKK